LLDFGRNYIESGEYIEKQFPNNNIRYIAILDGVDNFEDRCANDFAPIKGVFNELFCKETSKSVKRTKRKKMQEGYYACNVAPFGYKKDLDNPGKLIIDEPAAKIVKELFKLKEQGLSSKEIADIFNSRKIITPSEYMQIKGLENHNSNVWTRSMVNSILSKELYMGHCLRGKTQKINYKSKKQIYVRRDEQIITRNTHEPIVSEELYYKIHNKDKYGKTLSEKRTDFDSKAIFTKYMYCEYCQRKMEKRNSRGVITIYCRCRNEAEVLCNNKSIYKYEDIEKSVLESIQEHFNKYFANNSIDRTLLKKYSENKIENIKKDNKRLEDELKKITLKISKLYNERLAETITTEDYQKIYMELKLKRTSIEETIKDKNNEILKYSNQKDGIEKLKKIRVSLKHINNKTLIEEELNQIIKRIDINPNGLKIRYNFSDFKKEKKH